MSKFIEIAKKRFSCRDYSDKPVENEKILKILEAARIAPSACNLQPWYFYVLNDNKEILQKMQLIYDRDWFKTAPVVIIACADKNKSWNRTYDKKNHAEIDVSIAIDHITLAASDLDLATCWICHFDPEKVKKLLELPDYLVPVAIIPLGYPNSKSNEARFITDRKNLEQIVKFM